MKITNVYGLPQPLVDAVSSDYVYQEKRYSVTSLLKGVRETLLNRRHNDEIVQDVADMGWLILGNGAHKVCEDSSEAKDELKETPIAVNINGYTLSGRQDLYSESKKRITDYKTASVWKVIYDDFDDYRKQCLIYAWMFRKLGFEVDNAEDVCFLKDWSGAKAKYDSSYPQHMIYVKHFDFTEKDFKEIEDWLVDKFDEIEQCETMEDDLLPICSFEERWATPTKYAVMKKGNKKAIKLFENKADAEQYAQDLEGSHYVETREGEDKKCNEYCNVCQFCSYYKSKHKGD